MEPDPGVLGGAVIRICVGFNQWSAGGGNQYQPGFYFNDAIYSCNPGIAVIYQIDRFTVIFMHPLQTRGGGKLGA